MTGALRVVVILLVVQIGVNAQSPSSSTRDQAMYLQGQGWYNLNTAKANSINVDAAIRWKQDLRRIQAERNLFIAKRNADKKARLEEIQYQLQLRERQLRLAPTAADVQSGEALNALLYDLTDPSIELADWVSNSVALPTGMTVRKLIFKFTRLNGSSKGSQRLSDGVIALARLAVTGDEWHTAISSTRGLDDERLAYEAAYARVCEQILEGNFDLEAVQVLDKSLEDLKNQAKLVVPSDRGFRTTAVRFVEDLAAATRMFDAETVDYAREILVDTREHDATTVGELVAFMSKYRLQFATAERDPVARALYVQLHEALREQHRMLDIKILEPPQPPQPSQVAGKAIPNNVVARLNAVKALRPDYTAGAPKGRCGVQDLPTKLNAILAATAKKDSIAYERAVDDAIAYLKAVPKTNNIGCEHSKDDVLAALDDIKP